MLGGNGGFGGGGSSDRPGLFGLAGAFAAEGTSAGIDTNHDFGGGGAAPGAHVFVRGGASLTVNDVSADAGALTPGAGGASAPGEDPIQHAQPGQAQGSAFFLAGPTTFNVSAGKTRTISGSIADVGLYFKTATTAGFAPAVLTKTGTGTLVLDGANSRFSGGLTISQGAVQAVQLGGLGGIFAPTITFNDTNTSAADTTLTVSPDFTNPVVVAAFGSGKSTLYAAPGPGATNFVGSDITLNRDLTVSARSDPATPTQFHSKTSGPGGLTLTGGGTMRFIESGKTYTGRTALTGNSTLSIDSEAVSPVNSVVQVDAGSTLVLEGLTDGASIAGLAGAGTLSNNAQRAPSSLLNFGSADPAVTDTFTGTISGRIRLNKVGADTFELGAQDNTGVTPVILGGRLRLLGDLRVQNLVINKSDAGTQALDLHGHSMRFFDATLALGGLNSRLRTAVGDANDGIYDSSANSREAIGYGHPATGGGLLLKLTLAGDANLDNAVDFTDLVIPAQHHNSDFLLLWEAGDFTYDGKVDFTDLVKLAQNYGSTFPAEPIPGAPADFEGDLAEALARVPEPTAVFLPVMIASAIAQRRRRPQNRRTSL